MDEPTHCERCGQRADGLILMEFQGRKSPALCERCWQAAMKRAALAAKKR